MKKGGGKMPPPLMPSFGFIWMIFSSFQFLEMTNRSPLPWSGFRYQLTDIKREIGKKFQLWE